MFIFLNIGVLPSEKLETILSKGVANSRTKDYHDTFLYG